MAVNTKQVFLVPGQVERQGADGVVRRSPEIEHWVAIANSAQDAQVALEKKAPEFKPNGFTSLAAFEDAVVKLRQALNGEKTDWPLVVSDSVNIG